MKERLTAVKELVRRVLPWAGFPVFYVFCLLLFFTWTFPFDRLKERIVLGYNAQQRTGGSQQELQVDDLSSSWITGLKLHGVRLISPSSDPTKPPTEIKIDEATVRVSLLGLLVGNKDVTFHVGAFGGTIDGSLEQHGKAKSIDVDIDGVDVGRVPQIADTFGGLPVQGTLSGSIKLDVPGEEKDKPLSTPKTSGVVTLEIAEMAIGDGKAKIKIPMFPGGAPMELGLPRLNVGGFAFVAEAKEGVLTIKKFGAGGKDLELQGDGRLALREPWPDTGLDLNVRMKVNDSFRGKSDTTKTIFGAPGSSSALFDPIEIKKGVPISKAKRPDGFYAWHFRGSLAHPDYTPAATAAFATPGVKGSP